MTGFAKTAPWRFANWRFANWRFANWPFANWRFANLRFANSGHGSERNCGRRQAVSLGVAELLKICTIFAGRLPSSAPRFAAYALLAACPSLTPLGAQNPLAAQKAAPRLLLSASHLRRLERDRQRQTERWINLSQRVAATADSPERGFELALVYTVTHEEATAEEAIRWAASHPLEYRQIALIADWCRDRLPAAERQTILDAAWERATKAPAELSVPSPERSPELGRYRDVVFLSIARSGVPPPDLEKWWDRTMTQANNRGTAWLYEPEELYALAEIIIAVRESTRTDLRSGSSRRFEILPTQFLLSLHPAQVEAPSWQTRAAALALVEVDPNLTSSQFLQAWAMEDARVIRSGPGVAYEYLWANPYLPGVSYYNLDPWSYDPDAGVLYARSSWDKDSCWIRWDAAGVAEENCPAGWREHPFESGHLSVIPFAGGCLDVPRPSEAGSGPAAKTVIVSGLPPGARLTYKLDNQVISRYADGSGLLLVPINGEDRICPAGAHDRSRSRH